MKKILIFVAFILVISSCKKELVLESDQKVGLTVKEYAEIADNALLAKSKEQKSEKKDKEDDQEKDKEDSKYVTKSLISSGSGTIAYIPEVCGTSTFRFKSTGTAKSTILGSVTQETTFCIDLSTGQPTSAITGVGTTKSGDKVFYTFIGTGIDVATTFQYQDYVITGGTGKYTGATGTLHLLYHINTPTNYAYTGTGSIRILKGSKDED